MTIDLKTAQKLYPSLTTMVGIMELDNASDMSHWPNGYTSAQLVALEKLAARIDDDSRELMAYGEEREMAAFVKANKLEALNKFMEDVFNREEPVKEPDWWETEDSDSEIQTNPAPEARKQDNVSKKQKEAAPSTQTVKKPVTALVTKPKTGLMKAIGDVMEKTKAPKAKAPKAKAPKPAAAQVAKTAKVKAPKAPKPAPGLNPDLVTLLKAIKAKTGKGKSPVGNMVPRASVAHGFLFQKSGGLYSRGKNLGLLEVAEVKPEDGSGKVSSTALTQAGLDAISKPSKAPAADDMGLGN